jgi:hypothetical protein
MTRDVPFSVSDLKSACAGRDQHAFWYAKGSRQAATELTGADPLSVTEGDKAHQVCPPLPLLNRTRAYVREERAVAVRSARERNAPYCEPAARFMTKQG